MELAAVVRQVDMMAVVKAAVFLVALPCLQGACYAVGFYLFKFKLLPLTVRHL